MGYLATHFPPNSARASTLVPGDARVEFQEWQVPTLGQRSRDPVESVDGSIWWVGQWGNIMGRLDPAANKMQEYMLPENAIPHSVTIDKAGNAWYTGNKNGTIGRPANRAILVACIPGIASFIDCDTVRYSIFWKHILLHLVGCRIQPPHNVTPLTNPPNGSINRLYRVT